MYLISLLTGVAILTGIPATSVLNGRQVVHPDVWRLLNAAVDPVKVWVFLVDKGFRSEQERQDAVARVQAGYNPQAVRRRALRSVAARHGAELFTIRDVPVARSYVEAIAQSGAEVCVESRWLNAVSVRASAEQVRRIASLECVRWIEPVAWKHRSVPIEARGPDVAPQ